MENLDRLLANNPNNRTGDAVNACGQRRQESRAFKVLSDSIRRQLEFHYRLSVRQELLPGQIGFRFEQFADAGHAAVHQSREIRKVMFRVLLDLSPNGIDQRLLARISPDRFLQKGPHLKNIQGRTDTVWK